MPKLSINILTKDRVGFLERALNSIYSQTFQDFEVVLVNDGSLDNTLEVVENFKNKYKNLVIINHKVTVGISKSRSEALTASQGQYIVILDDDDEWIDKDKLRKQVEFLTTHPDYVLVGGAMVTSDQILKFRPESDRKIRKTMLFRNNFFTSTVMFSRQTAVNVGGFLSSEIDLAEDYDLWLRLGKEGKMYNFPDLFVKYNVPSYNTDKLLLFFKKQLILIKKYKNYYSFYISAKLILVIRIWLLKLKN